MKRSLLLAGLLGIALVLAGCGDDDASSSADSSSSTDDGAATAAPTATDAPSDDGDADPVPDPTTEVTTGATDPAVEAAAAVAGTYSGAWNNTTFGSTGPIAMEFEVDEVAEFALIRLDLGGFVFGNPDPDPIVFEIDLATEEWLGGGTELFGDTDFTVDDGGGWVLHSASVPGVGGLEMTMAATPVDGGYEGTYEIVGLAEGTFSLAPA